MFAKTLPLYAQDPLAINLDATVYVFDATTLDLCLSVYPWAPFRAQIEAIKLYTLLDLRGSILTFIHNRWQDARGQHARLVAHKA